eukprot:2621619-Pyramimonas_sp.AAC.1
MGLTLHPHRGVDPVPDHQRPGRLRALRPAVQDLLVGSAAQTSLAHPAARPGPQRRGHAPGHRPAFQVPAHPVDGAALPQARVPGAPCLGLHM